MDGDAESASLTLVAEVRARFPHSLGSVAFWLARDEASFTSSGNLSVGVSLPIYSHSAVDIAPAIRAACRDFSIDITPTSVPGVLLASDAVRPCGRAASPTPGPVRNRPR
jgi:hypothetical protein